MHCEVWPIRSSSSPVFDWDLCSTPSFLTTPCTSLYFPHDVLQHSFLLYVVVRQCRPVFGPLPSHGRWCHWPSASNVVVLPVNVLMKTCMPPCCVSFSASEVMGCAACTRDCDHAFGFLRLPRLPAFGTPSALCPLHVRLQYTQSFLCTPLSWILYRDHTSPSMCLPLAAWCTSNG